MKERLKLKSKKNLMGWDSLISEAKFPMQAKQNKEFIHFLLSAAACSATYTELSFVKTNTIMVNVPDSFSFSWPSVVEHNIWYRTSLWSVWVSYQSCVPSHHLVQMVDRVKRGKKTQKKGGEVRRGMREKEKSLVDAVQALLSSSQNTVFINTNLVTNPKHSTR